MKTTFYFLVFLFCCSAYGQNLILSDLDAASFPTLKAKFRAYDSNCVFLTNLSTTDFEVKENGIIRTVNLVSCPEVQPPSPISSVLVVDISGSMCGNGLDIAKNAASAWVNILPLGNSDCAITSFSDINYINQDFTTNKNKLVNGINSLGCIGGTDYNSALIDPMAGGILIAKTGKHKRIIVFLTDGMPNYEPRTFEIIKEAKANNITIYCITINMFAPQCMKDFADQTGGLYFDNINTDTEIKECFLKILPAAQSNNEFCQIEWQSKVNCTVEKTNVEVKLNPINTTSKTSYLPPKSSIAKLEFDPEYVHFRNAKPGIKKDTIITVTARNSNFNVTSIISSNPAFYFTPSNFSLTNGQSRKITVSFVPADSGYTYSKFSINNDICPTKYYTSGGFSGKKPAIQTLKLIHPNGNEIFVVGKDTVITWDGVLPQENVKIEYSTNNGIKWTTISDTATGLSFKWKIPKTPSNKCLARVTSHANLVSLCTNDNIHICNQIWMGCNLDVDTYRNGDPIPQVTDSAEWVNLKTGAWCYFNNDPAMGAIYGKLYNWYAVNDPRGLAPEGWHIPSDTEWSELADCLGGEDLAGGKLKESGLTHWWLPNTGATNESGFTALPGGWRGAGGLFDGDGFGGDWWSKEADWYLGYKLASLGRYNNGKGGFSVRCVMD